VLRCRDAKNGMTPQKPQALSKVTRQGDDDWFDEDDDDWFDDDDDWFDDDHDWFDDDDDDYDGDDDDDDDDVDSDDWNDDDAGAADGGRGRSPCLKTVSCAVDDVD